MKAHKYPENINYGQHSCLKTYTSPGSPNQIQNADELGKQTHYIQITVQLSLTKWVQKSQSSSSLETIVILYTLIVRVDVVGGVFLFGFFVVLVDLEVFVVVDLLRVLFLTPRVTSRMRKMPKKSLGIVSGLPFPSDHELLLLLTLPFPFFTPSSHHHPLLPLFCYHHLPLVAVLVLLFSFATSGR